MRVLFFGSGSLGIPSLGTVLGSEHELVGVITQPPRPAGRGGKTRPTMLAQAAEEMKLETTAMDNVNTEDSLAKIRRTRPDVILVVDFGQYISQAVCEIAPLKAFNLHASVLPELRSARCSRGPGPSAETPGWRGQTRSSGADCVYALGPEPETQRRRDIPTRPAGAGRWRIPAPGVA